MSDAKQNMIIVPGNDMHFVCESETTDFKFIQEITLQYN